MSAFLEHTNLTVREPKKIAEKLVNIFDWQVRWSGEALNNGYTVHVGSENSYLALYQPPTLDDSGELSETNLNNLNHLGVVVDNLDAVEARVEGLGLKPFGHRDYEPGQRFYFLLHDSLEIEVISYAK